MCQPSSPPVSFASEAIKLPLVTDLDIGLEDGERWTLLDRDRAMVVHPTKPPKIVYPDGRVEEIGSKTDP
jgi:hypothetical protein